MAAALVLALLAAVPPVLEVETASPVGQETAGSELTAANTKDRQDSAEADRAGLSRPWERPVVQGPAEEQTRTRQLLKRFSFG